MLTIKIIPTSIPISTFLTEWITLKRLRTIEVVLADGDTPPTLLALSALAQAIFAAIIAIAALLALRARHVNELAAQLRVGEQHAALTRIRTLAKLVDDLGLGGLHVALHVRDRRHIHVRSRHVAPLIHAHLCGERSIWRHVLHVEVIWHVQR